MLDTDNNLFCELSIPLEVRTVNKDIDKSQLIAINDNNDKLLSFANLYNTSTVDNFQNTELQQVSIQMSVMIQLMSKLVPSTNQPAVDIKLFSNRIILKSDVPYNNTNLILAFPIIDALPLSLELPVKITQAEDDNAYVAHFFGLDDAILDKLDKWIFVQNRKKLSKTL